MACINSMLGNNDQYGGGICPRISFSNDFGDSHNNNHQHSPMMLMSNCYKEAPVSCDDFEFSVSRYDMISADEVFSKGKIVPLKHCTTTATATTLRDELMNGEEESNVFSSKVSKGWRERLGLRSRSSSSSRSHAIVFPVVRKSNNNLQTIDETN